MARLWARYDDARRRDRGAARSRVQSRAGDPGAPRRCFQPRPDVGGARGEARRRGEAARRNPRANPRASGGGGKGGSAAQERRAGPCGAVAPAPSHNRASRWFRASLALGWRALRARRDFPAHLHHRAFGKRQNALCRASRRGLAWSRIFRPRSRGAGQRGRAGAARSRPCPQGTSSIEASPRLSRMAPPPRGRSPLSSLGSKRKSRHFS